MSDRNRDNEYSQRERTETTDPDPNPNERGKWISALIALLGLWMLVESALFELAPGQLWNDVIVGVLLIAVGGYNYYRRGDEQLGNIAAASVAAVLGLWLVAAPFVLGVDAGATETANDLGFWNDIVVGLLALGLGAYSAYKARDRRQNVHRTAG
ncbi:SPW repeat protein [Haloprofundus salinisoli]|uniref:SPW repeat protein n=1 Tax=Haloprofundus salinisoli TaxID=2876193 RepID=UPI001CCE2C37|nr:SPW repeat protein [Haloprofundus salinisoli]